jgi:hypothetical protein
MILYIKRNNRGGKMKIENVEKAGQILTKHLKNNKNILILSEGYATGKTSLLNEIISNLENKEKILFISRMDELYKKNKGINHIFVNGDKYSEIDYEMIEKQGYEIVLIDDMESFIIDEKEKISIPSELANIIVHLMKERKMNFVFSLDRGRMEDMKSIIHFFDELNQKQYKKKVIDIVAIASVDLKMKHSFKILEL